MKETARGSAAVALLPSKETPEAPSPQQRLRPKGSSGPDSYQPIVSVAATTL